MQVRNTVRVIDLPVRVVVCIGDEYPWCGAGRRGYVVVNVAGDATMYLLST